MTKAYLVYLPVAYEADIEFGIFKNEDDANTYRDELINQANMSHYRDITIGIVRVWDSVQEMKDWHAEDLANWQKNQS